MIVKNNAASTVHQQNCVV